MKITDEMYQIVKDFNPGARNIVAGLEAALKGVPDVEPFTFAGYPDNPVYMHSTCGTVVDVHPDSRETRAQVDAGECDCENDAPWLRVFVEKQA